MERHCETEHVWGKPGVESVEIRTLFTTRETIVTDSEGRVYAVSERTDDPGDARNLRIQFHGTNINICESYNSYCWQDWGGRQFIIENGDESLRVDRECYQMRMFTFSETDHRVVPIPLFEFEDEDIDLCQLANAELQHIRNILFDTECKWSD